MDPQVLQVVSLVTEHKWFALAALIIGLVVRLLKSDGPIPVNIPSKYRSWLAIGLGVLAGVIDKLGTGVAWAPAIAGGVIAALFAMGGHVLVVESARGGRELGESKEKFAKRSLRPPPMPATDEKPS